MARLTLLLAALLAIPIAAQAQTPKVLRPYFAELARQCPRQHLEKMTAGDIELVMEGFEARLTPAQTRAVQDAVANAARASKRACHAATPRPSTPSTAWGC